MGRVGYAALAVAVSIIVGTEAGWWALAPERADSLIHVVLGTAYVSMALSYLLRQPERRGMWRARTTGFVALLAYGMYSIARGAWPAVGIAPLPAILLGGLAAAAIALGIEAMLAAVHFASQGEPIAAICARV